MGVRRVTILALSLLALAACGSAGGSGTSGLQGTVTRGPITPVCQVGRPCSAPAKGVVLVFRRSGGERRARTDSAGRYRIALTPGLWSVSLTRTGIGYRLTPVRVRVDAGRFRVVNLSIDTGIR